MFRFAECYQKHLLVIAVLTGLNGGPAVAQTVNALPEPATSPPPLAAPTENKSTVIPSASPAPPSPVAAPAITATPLAPPAVSPVPEAQVTPQQGPSSSPALQPQAGPAVPALPTLIATPGDTANVDSVTLSAKPAVIMAGKAPWDDAFGRILATITALKDSLPREGLVMAGRPVTMFVQTDDSQFSFEVLIPVQNIAEGQKPVTPNIRFGKTPEGKAFRFVHKAPYDDIDSTYEAVTAYLDAKNIVVNDTFIEEYVSDLTKSDDVATEINIFVTPK